MYLTCIGIIPGVKTFCQPKMYVTTPQTPNQSQPNRIEAELIYPCPFVCLSIRMKIQISEAMRATNTNKNIKRGKHASFDMPMVSYSSRFVSPLIVPILVFYNGAEYEFKRKIF